MKLLHRLATKYTGEPDVIDRPDQGPYLTRWVLAGKRVDSTWLGGRALFLHRFQRSDHDEMHDHPWPFVSLILSGGYWEVTPAPGWKNGIGPVRRRWYGPGRMLYRPANWIHKVEIPEGKEATTLILRGKKARSWGFWCPLGFTPWRDYIARLYLTNGGCER